MYFSKENQAAVGGHPSAVVIGGSAMKTWQLVSSILVLLGILTACESAPPYKQVRLSENTQIIQTGSHPSGKMPLRVAVAGIVSPKETLSSYRDLITYLGQRLERPVELVQRKTYAEVNDLIRTGMVDLAFVCTGGYLVGQREFGMELLLAPQVNGAPIYYSYLIVPSTSAAHQLSDLRGKTFAFTDPMSLTGRQYPLFLLEQINETPEGFFRQVIFTYSHDNAIKAVAQTLVDGAAVDGLIFDAMAARDAELASRVRIIHQSPPLGIPPVVVHPGLNSTLKEQLRQLLLGLDQEKEGQALLRALQIERFVVVSDRQYDFARQVYFRERK
jgi:phosphonate transport system substrate-binding protein